MNKRSIFCRFSLCRMNPLYQITHQFPFNRPIDKSGFDASLVKDKNEYAFRHHLIVVHI